jgi:deazaflavin-dependent oxidoreductase (nitroreductase family)
MTKKVTASGRAVNFVMNHAFGAAKKSSRKHAEEYERSAGTKRTTLNGKPVFRLNVRGRTSGEPRSVMLMLATRGEELIVVGSQGGRPEDPNWWRNLVAAGEAVAQVGADTFPVTFRQVTDPDERAEVWSIATAAYPDFDSYQALTDRVIPVGILTRS